MQLKLIVIVKLSLLSWKITWKKQEAITVPVMYIPTQVVNELYVNKLMKFIFEIEKKLTWCFIILFIFHICLFNLIKKQP